MSRRSQQRLLNLVAWLLVEIVLNFLGLDELFDCSEFIFDSKISINCARNYQLMSVAFS
jgi:hypothetical protein